MQEVAEGLQDLSGNTLLFLTHIKRIDYRLPNGNRGTLERIEYQDGRVEIHTRYPDGKRDVSHWLRYQKNISIYDGKKYKQNSIAIAYSLEEEKHEDDSSSWRIVPIDHGQVSIYFPAAKETSNLKFHTHAPFASTVARDSVRDCPENNQLRDKIAELVVESLFDIRDKGMLQIEFLAVLPNNYDSLSKFYIPIRSKIIAAFQTENLTPTRSGSYAPANMLYRGPAKIAEVLGDDDLSKLINEKAPLWVANPPQQNQRDDRFLDSLNINSWDWLQLSALLGNLESIKFNIGSWLAKKR